MKTVTTLIAAVSLATASAAVNAADAQPVPVFSPFVMSDTEQAFMVEHHRIIAEQQRAFAEQQAAAVRNAVEAQRKFAEQMAIAPVPSTAFARPVAASEPFTMPEMPPMPAPFELSEIPAAPSIAGLEPEIRRSEMRKYLEERREAMRKIIQKQRAAAVQERDKYLEQINRIRPRV